MQDYIFLDEWDEVTGMDGEEENGPGFYEDFDKHFLSLTFYIENFNINVKDKEDQDVGAIPASRLTLQFLISLPRLLNQMQVKPLGEIRDTSTASYHSDSYMSRSLTSRRGMYQNDFGLLFPYINRNSNYSNSNWNGVCLGDLESSMRQNAANLNIASLILQFQQWATTYKIGVTHPLNPIYLSHYGIPGHFHDNYRLTNGTNTQNCYERLLDNLDNSQKYAKSVCDEIKCALRDSCDGYVNMTKTMHDEENMTDEQKKTAEEMVKWMTTARNGGLNG
jgi:hypothetical protein